MINIQPIEKSVWPEDGMLQVHSIFYTLQGEGIYAGVPAVFVRLAGCNLQCPGCDTDYTTKRRMLLPESIYTEISRKAKKSKLVVITGGEPFRQPLKPLIELLLDAGKTVQLETNGTLYQELPYDRITVVCSPKTGALNKLLEPHLAALKYVLDSRSVGEDGLPLLALGHGKAPVYRPTPEFKGLVYVQPYDQGEGMTYTSHVEAATKSCLEHGYTLCLQMHKFLNLE